MNIKMRSITRTPNIISGTVTRSAHRRFPNWLKALVAVLVTIIALTVVGSLTQQSEAASKSIPACKYEDGSGQSACYWDAATMGNGAGGSDYVKVGK